MITLLQPNMINKQTRGVRYLKNVYTSGMLRDETESYGALGNFEQLPKEAGVTDAMYKINNHRCYRCLVYSYNEKGTFKHIIVLLEDYEENERQEYKLQKYSKHITNNVLTYKIIPQIKEGVQTQIKIDKITYLIGQFKSIYKSDINITQYTNSRNKWNYGNNQCVGVPYEAPFNTDRYFGIFETKGEERVINLKDIIAIKQLTK